MPTDDPFKAAAATPDTPSSGGAPAGGAEPPAGGQPNGEPPEGQQKPDFQVAKPEYVPEKFWDKENNKVREEDVFKSYTELEKQLTKAKEPPKAPEKYEYKPADKLTKDYGLKELDMNDPYVSRFTEFAKGKGYTQEQYQEFIDFYLDMELSEANKQMVAEFGKLGDQKTAVQRVKVLNTFANNKLSKEGAATMTELAKSAGAVKLFEELITLATKGRNPTDEDPSIGGQLSEVEVNAMMKDERYWNNRHPEHETFVAKVTKEFERLYPDKKG